MSMMDTFKSDDYSDGRTKQAFKDATDINKILAKAAKGQTITHLAKHGAIYGDFSDIDDLLTAHDRLQAGQRIFDDLPSEVRREFKNNIGTFYNYVNDPSNKDDLVRLLPQLAKRGDDLPNIKRTPTNIDSDPVVASNTPVDPSPGEPTA